MAHGLTITRRDIEQAERHLSRGRRDPATAKLGARATGQLRQTAEIGIAALGMGVVNGRFGPVSLGPVPVDLIGFVVLTLGNLFEVAGPKYSQDLGNFGNGLGAAYLHTLGAGLGNRWAAAAQDAAQKAGTPLTTKTSGSIAGALGHGSSPLTEAELRAMAHAVR